MANLVLGSTLRSAAEQYDNEQRERLESENEKLEKKQREKEEIQAELEKLGEQEDVLDQASDEVQEEIDAKMSGAAQTSNAMEDLQKAKYEKFESARKIRRKIRAKLSQGRDVSGEIENIKREVRNIEMNFWNQLNQPVGSFNASRVTATMPMTTFENLKYRTPLSVKKWSTFENLFVTESQDFKKKMLTQKINFACLRNTLDRTSSNEATISSIFHHFLSILLDATDEVYNVRFSFSPKIINSVGLRPDHTMFWNAARADTSSASTEKTTLSFPIEMKIPTTFTPVDDDDLTKEVTRDDERSLAAYDLHPVNQIFTYSCTMKSRYAVLSTFEKTWFAERNGDDISFSRAFRNDDTGMSLARAGAVFLGIVAKQESEESTTGEGEKSMEFRAEKINQARTKSNSGNTTPREERATDSSVTTSEAYRGQCSRGDLSDLPLDDIAAAHNPTEVFHGLNDRIAIRNDLHGYDSVIKVVDAPQDREGSDLLEHEASIYMNLRGLWGKYMPGMVFAGPLTLARTALAVTYEGESLDRLKDLTGLGMSKEDLTRKACEALTEVHKAGVLHGALGLRHVVVDPKRKSLKLIGFENAEEVQPGPEGEEWMRYEMDWVSSMFESFDE